MKFSKTRNPVACLMAALCLLLGCAPLSFAEGNAFRTSRYFEGSYSAYASAVEVAPGEYKIEIYLQPLSGYAAGDAITSYALSVNSGTNTAISASSNGDAPLAFEATVPITGEITALTLLPTRKTSGETASETLDLFPASDAGSLAGQIGIVNNPDPEDRLNLRNAPSTGGESLRHYYNGVDVHILNALLDGWVAVSIGSEGGMARGYMKADFLSTGDEAKKVQSMIPTLTPLVDSWSLYPFPDENSTALGVYGKEDAFEVLGESSSWWHIRVGDNTGFVRAGVLTAEATPAPISEVIERESAPAPEESANSLRRYFAEENLSTGHSVKATIEETGENRFWVEVVVALPENTSTNDTPASYVLYVNGKKKADVPLDADASADNSSQVFLAAVALDETIDSLRLSPIWTKGGELEEGAVTFAIQP